MKDHIASFYHLLGVSSNCSDEQLRRAYLNAMKRHHPDVNPGNVNVATSATQRITEAYGALKEYRQLLPASRSTPRGDMRPVVFVYGDGRFDFGRDPSYEEALDRALVTEVTERKNALRQAYADFHAHPTSVMAALRVISAAIACEREDAIEDLLKNPILIDSAALLYGLLDSQSASAIIRVWERFLWQQDMTAERTAMLEDAVATGQASDEIKNALRSHYYYLAKGEGMPGRPNPRHAKPSPETRIKYLMKIVEFGDAHGYVYKQLAEAHYDNGDPATARAMLRKAYEIDPNLTGAVKISRALGMAPPKANAGAELPNTPYRDARASRERKRSQRINGPYPSLAQVREWASEGAWSQILVVAHRTDYGRNERETMRLIAQCLGSCPDDDACDALIALMDSFYWDVHVAACASLAKVGTPSTLEALRKKQANESSMDKYLASCIEYLSCRLSMDNALDPSRGEEGLIERGRRAFSAQHFEQARCILEHALGLGAMLHAQSAALLTDDEQNHDARFLLARCCAEMGDTERAIHLMLPVRDHMSASKALEARRALADWLWSYLVSATYDPSNDHLYTLALDMRVGKVLTARAKLDFLGAIRYLTRWLELVSAGELVSWIRTQVGDAAPGYGELRRGAVYLRDAKLSEALQLEVNRVERRLKAELPKKLQSLFNASATLGDRRLLLDE